MQNAQVQSAETAHEVQSNSQPNNVSTDTEKSGQSENDNKSCTSSQYYLNKDPIFTSPISVKPKTQEPERFTDNRIYVSNIPFSFRQEDLAAMFYPYGKVLDVDIVTNDRGSKGFGFVTLDSIAACERARAALHESHVQGRIIEVRRATPTRKKVPNNVNSEIIPPPKLQVDLRAPHSLWQPEPDNKENFQFAAPYSPSIIVPTPHEMMYEHAMQRVPFSCAMHPNRGRHRCTKHHNLKLSANGQYYLNNGVSTSDDSLLNCLGISDSERRQLKKQQEFLAMIMRKENQQSEYAFPSGPPTPTPTPKSPEMTLLEAAVNNQFHDELASLLGNNMHQPLSRLFPMYPPRKSESVTSGIRTSESDATSDEESSGRNLWTPNTSPDILASLYDGCSSSMSKF
ncbi:unnamed protein product [Caenorhabditis bovis]|uniref:RRM domain-containing protein n=1 Tax=Caenorhabditis bovis TaxID=2654633 RepID=A0A8S1EGP0_9PELO|nr:unnamed protein product [Caenorhabditis bovis]